MAELKTYTVIFEVDAGVSRTVEASSPEEAEQKARAQGSECSKEVYEAFLGKVSVISEE
jgi:hypothetical protein